MRIKLIYDTIDLPDYYRGNSNVTLQIEAYNGQTIKAFKFEMTEIIDGSTLDEFVLCKDPTEDIVNEFISEHFPHSKDEDVLVEGLFETEPCDTYYHYIEVYDLSKMVR